MPVIATRQAVEENTDEHKPRIALRRPCRAGPGTLGVGAGGGESAGGSDSLGFANLQLPRRLRVRLSPQSAFPLLAAAGPACGQCAADRARRAATTVLLSARRLLVPAARRPGAVVGRAVRHHGGAQREWLARSTAESSNGADRRFAQAGGDWRCARLARARPVALSEPARPGGPAAPGAFAQDPIRTCMY